MSDSRIMELWSKIVEVSVMRCVMCNMEIRGDSELMEYCNSCGV